MSTSDTLAPPLTVQPELPVARQGSWVRRQASWLQVLLRIAHSPMGAFGLGTLVLLVLLAALAYAVGEALLLALLARDLRTAQNLNGALLLPITALSGAALLALPSGLSLLVVAALLVLGAAACTFIGLRWLTFERYLL
jgi:hypothetical protein